MMPAEIRQLMDRPRSELTEEQKLSIRDAILNDPDELKIAQNGALLNGDYGLFYRLMRLDNPNHWLEVASRSNQTVPDHQHLA